jgi:arsenical pump membrane protein
VARNAAVAAAEGGASALLLALALLAASLAVAVRRPRWLSEAVVPGMGALLLLAVGAIGSNAAGHALSTLAPTVGFLAALLILADGCRREGLFVALGSAMSSHAGNRPRRLLALVFAAASATTIVLGLDATVVLLTPVVILAARRRRLDPRAPLYACAHLANSASLLLPVSNLTNLLAFRASGLSFVRFAALMLLPTVGVIAVEWAVLSRWGRPSPSPGCAAVDVARAAAVDVAPGNGSGADLTRETTPAMPRFALIVVGLTLAGFALSSGAGVDPVWVAVAGAAAMSLPALVRRTTGPVALAQSLQPGFLVFVLALGVIVAAAGEHGLTSAMRAVLPAGSSLGDLLLITLAGAVLANLVNNLPATLILVPVAAGLGPGPVLAVLVGVNIGPNLTEVGSLATLLWRRVLRQEGVSLPLAEFVRLGAVTVPPALVAATTGLWVVLRVL